MVGEEDVSSSWGQYQASSNSQRKFWRSASWSSSRSMFHNPENEEKDGLAQKFPVPLTPRPQQNSKARSSLPPLQPLAIARRSLEEWPRAGSDDIGEWPGPPTLGGRDVNKSGERLKLDIAAIQRSPYKNGALVKRDKIAFFDKECSKVAEHIYLGGDAVARDRDILKQNGITHVLNCVGFVCPDYFKADFLYRTLWLQDSPSEDITSILYDVFDYFEDVREQKGRVFVHCCQGVSRSTSLVIAYLMWREGQSFDDAFQYVKQARGIADPNMGFACQLLQCQKRVHAFPLSPSSLLRMYRIALHSPYDPLHLVPKMLNSPSASALDSRGAFVIQVPSAIYVWIGKSCEVVMERDARGSVCQIVRYERVQVPVHVIKDGEEPSFFWDVFSDFSLDKSDSGVKQGESSAKILPGERKVALYDLDFEIFQKAIMGGFMPPLSPSEAELETRLPARENSWSALRCKFAAGHMKEFVSAPKLVSNRLCSDPRLSNMRENLVIRSSRSSDVTSVLPSSLLPSSLMLPSSLSSLSSSPPHLSPDSICSESSNTSKCSSESPLESPMTLSGTLSTFSYLPLLSSENSPNISNHPGYIEVNFPSKYSQRTSSPTQGLSPSQRSPLSIAKRRGSFFKCLKLPLMNDRRTKDTKNCLDCQEDDVKISQNFYCLSKSDNAEQAADTKDAVRSGERDFEVIVSSIARFDSSPEESSSGSGQDVVRQKYSSTKNDEANALTDTMKVGSSQCNHDKTLVYNLPSLEKSSMFGACELDTKSAFAFIAPSSGSSISEDRTSYLWIGRSFNFSRNQNEGNRAEVGDVRLTDSSQFGSDILLNMGLLKDTNIKIIKEGEEPADFLAMLGTL